MGCGSSTGAGGKIRMQKTRLTGMDDVFDDVQKILDKIYDIQDPIDDAFFKLLRYTGFEKTVGATAHHCVVGTVFAIATANGGENAADLFEVKGESPFLILNKSNAKGDLSKAIDAFTDYVKALTGAKDQIQPLADKAKEFAAKAPDLPSKAKDDIKNAEGLNMMAKAKAIKNTASNCKAMASLPSTINDFKNTIEDALMSIKASGTELNGKKDKLPDIAKNCASKKLVSAKDCYLEAGDKIEVDDKAKKRFAAQQKKQKSNKRGTKK
jgi:hypothetical protein